MTVAGFQPIFRGDVELTARSGVSVILGGNGLGKTTLMQALIYALTGGVSEEIEEDKRLRWGHAYFRSRLNAKQLRAARVWEPFDREQSLGECTVVQTGCALEIMCVLAPVVRDTGTFECWVKRIERILATLPA